MNRATDDQSSSDSQIEDGPVQLLERKVEDLKMFATMCLAVCYVFSMTIVCGHFSFNTEAFTDQAPQNVYCYVNGDVDVPTTMFDPKASDVARTFQSCIEMGFYVHLLGIFGDASFAARVYVKKTNWFRLGSLILVSLYTLLWLAWLVWLHVVVFNHAGKVCKGSYLPDSLTSSTDALPGYALHQGQVLTNIIIGIWSANGAIVLGSVVIGVLAARYLKREMAGLEQLQRD